MSKRFQKLLSAMLVFALIFVLGSAASAAGADSPANPFKWATPRLNLPATSDSITYEISYANRDRVYTQAEVDAMTKEEISRLNLFPAKLTYIIPENYSESTVNIYGGDAVADAMNICTYMPGEAAAMQIEIVNRSRHTFAYTDGSFGATTDFYQPMIEDGTLTATEAIGFDGQKIPTLLSIRRAVNPALKELYGKTGKYLDTDLVTDASLAEKLIAKGYAGGVADLHTYYLDFFNTYYKTSHTSLDQFTDSQLATISGKGNTIWNGFETNPRLIALFYDYFYNHLLSLTPPTMGRPENDDNSFTVGALMREYNTGKGTVMDDSINEAWAEIGAGQTAPWQGVEIWLHGPDTCNAYQGYNFGFTLGFQLHRTDSDVTVTKVDAKDQPITGAEFKLYKKDADPAGRLYYAVSDNGVFWTPDAQKAAVLKAGSVTLNLPLGTYYLTEITPPQGYEALEEDAVLTVDEITENFRISNALTPVSVSVTKVWVSDTDEYQPDSIRVQLLRDGQPFEAPVELNAENQWSHSWENLAADSEWSVAEAEVPEYYVETTSHEGNHWTITNTLDTELIDPEEPPKTDNPQTGDPSPVLWITAAVLCAGAAAVLVMSFRQKEF